MSHTISKVGRTVVAHHDVNLGPVRFLLQNLKSSGKITSFSKKKKFTALNSPAFGIITFSIVHQPAGGDDTPWVPLGRLLSNQYKLPECDLSVSRLELEPLWI